MANIFVISDTHFGHDNMYRFVTFDGVTRVRKEFENAAQADEAMVERWNAVVRASDHVYHLGDVAMRKEHLETVKRLNGHKRLVLGNHDIFDVKAYLACGFGKVCGSRVLDKWILTHIPIHPESMGRFKGNIHGHIHERAPYAGPYVNVSVEKIAYTPIPLETITCALKAT